MHGLASWKEIEKMTAKKFFELLQAIDDVKNENALYLMMCNSGSMEIYQHFKQSLNEIFPYVNVYDDIDISQIIPEKKRKENNGND